MSIFVGWDPREVEAFEVCEYSLRRRSTATVELFPLVLEQLRRDGLYTRPTALRDGRLWDERSGAPMSTEFAISRFFVPLLAIRLGLQTDWALFCDCDFLWLGDVTNLFRLADPSKALCCVQHNYRPDETSKMDGQAQLLYERKNWSSLMLFNLRHPAHEQLTVELLNTVPGLDLHRFCWLADDEIGALPSEWNWLEGWSPIMPTPPHAVHFTRGGPWLEGWDKVQYADFWIRERQELKLHSAAH